MSAGTVSRPQCEYQGVRRDVRFGSQADILGDLHNVRFTPESGHCGIIPVADYPFSPMSDLPHQWVGNSAAGKSAAERGGRSRGW
jgi:hypothetical protein